MVVLYCWEYPDVSVSASHRNTGSLSGAGGLDTITIDGLKKNCRYYLIFKTSGPRSYYSPSLRTLLMFVTISATLKYQSSKSPLVKKLYRLNFLEHTSRSEMYDDMIIDMFKIFLSYLPTFSLLLSYFAGKRHKDCFLSITKATETSH